MAVAPLSAKRGRLKTLYQGRVLVLDVMTNNPGATGGAVVDLQGRLVGMLGKELRDDQTNIWLNYAIPADVVASSVRRILEGKTNALPRSQALKVADKPHRLSNLGIVLIPDILPKTPAYVDQVLSKSIAARCGLRANDLILLMNDLRIDSRRSLEDSLASRCERRFFYAARSTRARTRSSGISTMMRNWRWMLAIAIVSAGSLSGSLSFDARAADILQAEQDALRAAGDFAQRSVVQIETFGGREVVGDSARLPLVLPAERLSRLTAGSSRACFSSEATRLRLRY